MSKNAISTSPERWAREQRDTKRARQDFCTHIHTDMLHWGESPTPVLLFFFLVLEDRRDVVSEGQIHSFISNYHRLEAELTEAKKVARDVQKSLDKESQTAMRLRRERDCHIPGNGYIYFCVWGGGE